MNFLTNFSLVLSFGIAIDVIIVIIEGASEKLKLGYSNKNAILLAIKDLNKPMISGAATTLGAFLPLMFLPGMLGTFLAYIPITVFCIVISALVLSLTLNSAVFYKLNGNSKYYTPNEFSEDLLSDNEKKILENDRESKQVKIGFKGLNTIVFDGLKNFYILLLNFILKYRFNRILVIIIPFLLLIITFFTISSKIGFTIFPNSDTDSMQINIEGKKGLTSDYMLKYTENFDQVFNNILEIKDYSYNINGNKISIDINLLSVEKRRDLGMNSVFEVESKIIDKFSYLTLQGLEVKTSIQSGGPPSGSPVGVRIVTDDIKYFDDLLTISKKFEDWLAGQDSILSTSISSDELPGQYVLKYKDFALNEFGLSPDRVSNEIFTYLNGQNVSSIRKGKDSFDVIIKSNKFGDEINPSNIMNINVGKVNVGEIADVSLGRAVDSIQRRDNDIIVNVDGELKRGEESRTQEIQSKFVEFAKNYNYPDGIYFQEAGEGQENKELIVATIISFIIALLIIFSVLVLQFDSYLQPLMILYSIVMAMLGVNIGLWVTGNPYSMPFAIGFISLTGIVVNNAIILIDRMNNNLEQTNKKKMQ
ncbi:efflux RND transporter permease subunit [Candidatus Vampirococcus lugosii]|nr:efflux RND transporter permease subunit [Candidatus Vampirococcus lugosii]